MKGAFYLLFLIAILKFSCYIEFTEEFNRHTPMTSATVTAQSIATTKSELRQMVCHLHTANTYQQALNLWQSENRSLTEDEINQVMGVAKPAADPFGEQIENAGSEFDPFG
ncbi:hypothetical protein Lepto7375DRAFT_0612 [Leptolyngbya sp. PCC 7375]|nr:hypothetical protein Lepto7375DRAFT_0612 [Leptolyngbya sp. PCC 7375]